MFDPSGCLSRLRGCPCLEERRALLRRGFVCDSAIRSEAGAFLVDGGFQHNYQDKDKGFGTLYIIAADNFSPEARSTTGSGNGTRL